MTDLKINNSLTSFLFRYRFVKIIILLTLHVLGALILGLLIFTITEYILASIGFIGGNIMGNLWNNLKLNLLPPIIISLSLIVILVPNPIYALAALIFVFFNTAIFLIGIHVEFLALIYVIIYIGAIAILFLFVIMMFNLKELRDSTSYTQNKDFLTISLSFYLLILYKFYYLLVNAFLNYIEYDLYINEVIALKYKLLFGQSQVLYTHFIQDIIYDLSKDLLEWKLLGIDPYKIYGRIEPETNVQNNELIPQIYKWYLERTVNSGAIDLGNNSNSDFLAKQIINDITSSLSSAYTQPIDILICGQILYTYYSYLFLISTTILLISMIGAIILALSTTEKTMVESTSSENFYVDNSYSNLIQKKKNGK